MRCQTAHATNNYVRTFFVFVCFGKAQVSARNAMLRFLRLLLERRADVNARAMSGQTLLLHWALLNEVLEPGGCALAARP